MTEPIVSLITVSYNSKEYLTKSLEMLKKQDYPFIESIIIDGGSTDGSIDIIKDFSKEFSDLYEGRRRTCTWRSESDEGAYYALNKGLEMATGDIIGCYWDMYATEHTITDIVNTIINENADGAHGDLVYVDDNGRIVRNWREGNGTIRQGWMPGHPTLYLKKEIYDRYGRYDTSYKISSDYEFMVRCLKDGQVRLSYIPEQLIKMFYGGMSSAGIKSYLKSVKEVYRALTSNKVRPAFLIVCRRTIRTVLQFVEK